MEKLFRPDVLVLDGECCGKGAIEVLAVPDDKGGIAIRGVKGLLDPYRDRPERRAGTATMHDLLSFIRHVNRFKDQDSAVFAAFHPAMPFLRAVLDYHESESEEGREPEIGNEPASNPKSVFLSAPTFSLESKSEEARAAAQPRFGAHRTEYHFPLSDEWLAWVGSNSKPMSQVDFAAFIEDRILDVYDPPAGLLDLSQPVEHEADQDLRAMAAKIGGTFASAAKLLELSRGMEVYAAAKLKESTVLQSGERRLVFEEEHRDADGRPITVPGLFLIAIPVFRSEGLFRLPVRLRYRAKSGGLVWWYELYKPEKVFESAFRKAAEL
ncbi:MAG: YfdQ family protein, partial [Rhodospirillales bacterium]|nr:YfdQ family protein [Rhodospirillales bacterium]